MQEEEEEKERGGGWFDSPFDSAPRAWSPETGTPSPTLKARNARGFSGDPGCPMHKSHSRGKLKAIGQFRQAPARNITAKYTRCTLKDPASSPGSPPATTAE
ncbi:unnamed protein product [Prorocentrum cordatum]|uniref:Uncharacterized protein n=1 Tax=Prorocentrum cordatum TaxID=2364126 RepID=A0ABN9SVL1_9DINO|nr:unnamed protein product [Polarella glacialis]